MHHLLKFLSLDLFQTKFILVIVPINTTLHHGPFLFVWVNLTLFIFRRVETPQPPLNVLVLFVLVVIVIVVFAEYEAFFL